MSKKYRIVEETETNGLGKQNTKYFIQRKTWFGWKKHSVPFMYHYGNDGHYIEEAYPHGTLSTIKKMLNDIETIEGFIRYKGVTIKLCYDSHFNPVWVNLSRYKVTPWGKTLYHYHKDLNQLKKIIDENTKETTRKVMV
jgi:hypothetical protein